MMHCILVNWYVAAIFARCFVFIACKLQKGVSSARSDDTKGLKGSILDWIVPKGQSLIPSLSRNVKVDRGFHHERTGFLLCPAGMDWADPEYGLRLIHDFCANAMFRVKEKLRNGEIIIRGDQWPLFLYADCEYDPDDPWKGLFKNQILVSVSDLKWLVIPS
jgi:hypothetical protein